MNSGDEFRLLAALGEALREDGWESCLTTRAMLEIVGNNSVSIGSGETFLVSNSRLRVWESFEIADPDCIQKIGRKLHEWYNRKGGYIIRA